MSSFIETPRFPDEIAAWAQGGLGFKTTVVETYGGNEFVNAAWSQARGEWDIADALRSTNANGNFYVGVLRNFHRVCRGQLYGFRFKNYAENDFADQGGGIFSMINATHFQMVKHYLISPLSYDMTIQKPVSPVIVTGGSVASIDYTTGIVTMTSGTPISWTGAFDIPCRFNMDIPRLGYESSGALFDWQQLKIIQIRNPG